MKEWGIEKPDHVPTIDDKRDWFKILIDLQGKGRMGTSSLSRWVCPECNLKVRIGIKGNPELVHEPCSEKKGEKVFFIRSEGLRQKIYESS